MVLDIIPPQAETFFKELGDKVFYPGSNDYNVSLQSYFTAQEAQLLPACIIRPTKVEDVATVIKAILAINSAAESKIQFAVRGGGHNPFPGSANIDGGITVDMRAMNTVTVHDRQSVSIGAGAIWGHVYEQLDPLNLGVVGGNVYGVGVSGFTLGGGLSSLSPRYGLCCDMVENFEVVLANGDVIEANKEDHPDLWVALKGGASNFGIVTRFDMKVFLQSKLWGGYLVSPISTLDESLAALASMDDEWDEYASVKQSFTFSPQHQYSIVTSMEYTKDTVDPEALKPFLNIKPMYRNTMKLVSLTEISLEVQKLQAVGVRQIFATTSFHLDVQHLRNVVEIFKTKIPNVENIEGMRWTLTYQRLHGGIPTKSAARGGNASCLTPFQKPLVLCILTYSWALPKDDDRITIAAKEFLNCIDEMSREAGLYHNYRYLNYAAGYQDPIGAYGVEAREKLQAVSKKYDPTGLFQFVAPGGFKVFS